MSMCKVETQVSHVAQTLEQQAAVILEMPSSGLQSEDRMGLLGRLGIPALALARTQ